MRNESRTKKNLLGDCIERVLLNLFAGREVHLKAFLRERKKKFCQEVKMK